MAEEKLSEPVMEAVRTGHTIQAIKRLRAETGLGLKEAKEIIEREIDTYRRAHPDSPMVPRSSPLPMLIVVAVIAAAVYWFLTKGG